MNKKGALFYIIDAFVAASIIAITITIIFSTSMNPPETEIVQEALENYISYIEQTSIVRVSGTTANSIINKEIVNNQEDTIISSIAQVYDQGNISLTTDLVTEISNIGLANNYGLNFSIRNQTVTRTLFTRNTDRLANTKTYLEKEMVVTVHMKAQENISTINMSVGEIGNTICAPNKCLYIIDDDFEFFQPKNHDEDACDDLALVDNWQARCYGYQKSKTGVYTIKVSVWS
jgi:hypothetical protein